MLMYLFILLVFCFTDSLESSSVQAVKDVKAAEHNEQLITKLRMQSESKKGGKKNKTGPYCIYVEKSAALLTLKPV